jgi:hypothetical protein
MAKGWQQRWVVPCMAALLMCCQSHVSHAELKTHQIKAAYLYQISKFVFWPEERKQVESFQVCQLGKDTYAGNLQKMSGRTVFNKPVTIRFVASLAKAKSCHLLILSNPQEINPKTLRKWLSENSVLTVVDGEDYWERGMVSFVLEKQRVRLHINLELAEISGLTFAANLLEVASEIHSSKEQ